MLKGKPSDLVEIWVCEDCFMPLAYGDFTGLDYYYSGDENVKRYEEVKAGMDILGTVYAGTDEEEEFSRNTCDCCGTKLAGKRHQVYYEEE